MEAVCEYVGTGTVRVILRESLMPASLDFYLVTELASNGQLLRTEYGVHLLLGRNKWAVYEPFMTKEIPGAVYQHSLYLPQCLIDTLSKKGRY